MKMKYVKATPLTYLCPYCATCDGHAWWVRRHIRKEHTDKDYIDRYGDEVQE